MIQITSATFEEGVFKPDMLLDLPPQARVRLFVESLEENQPLKRDEAWHAVTELWRHSSINSGGEHLTRERRASGGTP